MVAVIHGQSRGARGGLSCATLITRPSSDLDAPRMATDRKSAPPERNPGRPPTIGGRRVQVYLDDDSIARAKLLGGGNVSLGIRVALNIDPSGGQVERRLRSSRRM